MTSWPKKHASQSQLCAAYGYELYLHAPVKVMLKTNNGHFVTRHHLEQFPELSSNIQNLMLCKISSKIFQCAYFTQLDFASLVQHSTKQFGRSDVLPLNSEGSWSSQVRRGGQTLRKYIFSPCFIKSGQLGSLSDLDPSPNMLSSASYSIDICIS